MATKKAEIVEIQEIQMDTITVRLRGDTPLIMHCWSEKAKREMLEAQQGKKAGKKKAFKNPVEDFINSMYWIEGKPEEYTEEAFDAAIENGARFGFPVLAFKAAAVSAAFRNGWTKDKVSARGSFLVEPDTPDGLIEIHSDPPIMREDMVKIGMGTADLRYRGEFRNWYADLTLSWNRNGQYSLSNIISMLNAGGFSCGIGEWRMEKGGINGAYHVEGATD